MWCILVLVLVGVAKTLAILNSGSIFETEANPRFVSRENTFRVVTGDTVILPCEVQNLEGDKVVSQAAVFFFAGFETTSATISYTLYELCIHPQIQERLRKEIQSVIQDQGLTFEAIQNMPYLHMCVSETLRKYPVLPFLDRKCKEDYQIPGSDVVIEKGTPVYVSMFGLHYDPEYWPNPDKYDPERFSEENLKNIVPYSYIPFGEGPRICIGSLVIVWKRGVTLLTAGVQKITTDPRISLLGFNLQVRDIRYSDQGDYTCQIGDGSHGDLIHTVEILMPPSIQILPSNGELTSRKGGQVSFECRASGNPSPIVQWSKKDGLLPTGLQVHTGYLLSLSEVQRQDGGVYQCTASNGIGQPVTGEIRLHILYPPEVSALKSWVNSGEGLEAKLDCIVHADPVAEVQWYQDSFLLQPTDRRLMTNSGKTYTLTIRNVQLSDFGNYSCTVVNSIGRDKKYIELSGKPGPAKITSPRYSNPTAYRLTWTVQSVFPILEVRILYRRMMINASYHHPGQWHDLLVKPNQKYNPSTSERSQWYLIENLVPDSVYECLVQTKNQHGFGDLSDLHQWFSSQKGQPHVTSQGRYHSINYLLILILSVLEIIIFLN